MRVKDDQETIDHLREMVKELKEENQELRNKLHRRGITVDDDGGPLSLDKYFSEEGDL